jgi:hypothetical protein
MSPTIVAVNKINIRRAMRISFSSFEKISEFKSLVHILNKNQTVMQVFSALGQYFVSGCQTTVLGVVLCESMF